ncbi:MAG: hypothetical protein V4660_16015 [Pseudomonadota bacterium]
MKHIIRTAAMTAALVLTTSTLSNAAMAEKEHAHVVTAAATAVSATQINTQGVLRDLWVEHVFWVRNYVIASKASDENQRKTATDQVLANATAISGAIASYYGKAAGDQMLNLLAGHWGAVKDYSDATFAKDAKAQQNATEKLVANAKQIAAFLAKANPNLPEATLVGLLSSHGAHHLAQAQQIFKGDFKAEATTWTEMRVHMFMIADALTGALAKQFPEKFI